MDNVELFPFNSIVREEKNLIIYLERGKGFILLKGQNTWRE